jgi:hypothetical protein
MLSDLDRQELRALVMSAVNEVDTEIVAAIRRNDGRDGPREALLGQLDVIDKVRERLDGRIERIGPNCH